MRVRKNLIKQKAEELLEVAPFNDQAIDLDGLAAHLGIHVERREMPTDVEGMSFVEEGQKFIVLKNGGWNPQRERFTFAHEIGHHILHSTSSVNVSPDGGATILHHRDSNSSKGTIWQEKEANYFAACLLLPEQPLREAVAEILRESDLGEAQIVNLAERFDVSVQALSIRLGALGIVELM